MIIMLIVNTPCLHLRNWRQRWSNNEGDLDLSVRGGGGGSESMLHKVGPAAYFIFVP
jgi:hypothetical protein